MMESMGASMQCYMSNMQSQMPHIQFDNDFVSQRLNFNQQAAPNVEEEDEDQDLGADQC